MFKFNLQDERLKEQSHKRHYLFQASRSSSQATTAGKTKCTCTQRNTHAAERTHHSGAPTPAVSGRERDSLQVNEPSMFGALRQSHPLSSARSRPRSSRPIRAGSLT